MVFFLSAGAVICGHLRGLGADVARAGGIALGTLDVELFPTEVRGTSNALLAIVASSAPSRPRRSPERSRIPWAGSGASIALTGIGTLVAAIFLVPRLPESRGADARRHESDRTSRRVRSRSVPNT